ncbi:histone-lysine N-methyltransferase SETDB1-B-like [Centroberyx affinis]|uniref:histone-lysine N-methyltransferase SETDB1-B-like n=1 Tax=Centroberyx affinis TaxID=166261 RepID=UPI003A5B9AE7
MEGDEGEEIEMTEKELKKWIREKVENSELVDLDVMKRCHLLQSLVERREKQAATFLRLCESVAECEAVIKRLYSLLGWEYRDTDSDDEKVGSSNSAFNIDDDDDDDDDAIECDNMPQSPYEAVPPETQASSSLTTNRPTAASRRRRLDSKTRDTDKGKMPQREEASSSLNRVKKAVVVLSRLSEHTIRSALRPPVPQLDSSEEEDLSICDSDTQWEPKDDSSDSDCSNSSSETKSNKKKGTHQKTRKLSTDDATKTSKPQANTDAKRNATNNTTTPQGNTNVAKKTAAKQTTATVQKPNKAQPCALVVSSLSQAPNQPTVPPSGLPQDDVIVNMAVLARRGPLNWQRGKIREIVTKDDGRMKYKVDFEEKGRSLVSGYHIAFDKVPMLERLYIGARVVTKYQEDNQSRFCSGVLGELPCRKNRMRFLVFFDDHTPSYVGLPLLRLVCRPLKNVLEDIPDNCHRNFIEEYLKVWPNPPLTQYMVGQIINVELNGVQRSCQVQQVDCSLVHVTFQDDQHKEWIYRGSICLEHISSLKKHMEKEEHKDKPASKPTVTGSTQQTIHTSQSQADSTSTSKPTTSISADKTKQAVISKDHEQDVTIQTHAMVPYTPHRCCPACLDPIRPEGGMKEHRGQNPLLVPLLYNFQHKAPKRGSGQVLSQVYYRTPCGLRLRSMATVEDYLYQTHCDFLYLEMFCLDPNVSISTTYKPLPSKIYIVDLAMGKENQQVSCINEHNNIRPPAVTYTSNYVVTDGISINTSHDFMVGCDCTDGCRDSVACSCRQMTVQTTALSPGGPEDISAGYTHKRLYGCVTTGVYECNPLCRCDRRMCSNRVVQHGIQLRLQVFKTRDRGWGVRCLDDVAKGTFVCTYSGRVVRGEKNTHSNLHCAKLNHIEGVEIHKEDYETEAYCSESETAEDLVESRQDNNAGKGSGDDEDKNKEELGDSENKELTDARGGDSGSGIHGHKVSSIEKSNITCKSAKIPQKDKKVETGRTASKGKKPRDPPACEKKQNKSSTAITMTTPTSTRGLFDGEEYYYIVDSTKEGNVARYLNHSCSPNLFGQNVFVDTHDLRFPWLAFFTNKHITAGTELTWDYRSVIGGAEGVSRGLCCRCGSKNCCGKL